MGEVRADVLLENERDLILFREHKLPKAKVRRALVHAIIDTGAVMMLLPRDIVKALGLGKKGKAAVSLATDETVELEVAGNVSLTVAGRRWETDCLVGPPKCEPLIGQLVLERLDLIVDPRRRTLTPRPESPNRPTLKLKRLFQSASEKTEGRRH